MLRSAVHATADLFHGIVDRFATGFDDLPELIADRPDYRIPISLEMPVPRFAVVCQPVSDAVV